MRRMLTGFVLCAVTLTGVGLAPGAVQAVQSPQDLLVSDNPVNFTPHVLDGEVLAIAVVGNKVVLGGEFTRAQNAAGGPEILRTNILAFDRTTGQIDTAFVPVVDNTVRTLAPAADGQSVFIGGQFNAVNGQTRYKVARLAIANGQHVGGFNAGLVNSNVEDLKLVGNRLFIAGHFTKVRNQSRMLFAELDPATGALRPSTADFEGVFTNGAPFIRKIDINPDGNTLVAVGNFMTVNAQPRVQVAMLDVSAAPTLADWRTTRLEPICRTTFGYYVRDVDFSPDGGYFVVATTGSAGPGVPTLCDSASRWDADARGEAVDPTWVDYTGGDSTYSVALTGTAGYIGGHMRWFNNPYGVDTAGPGAVERSGIAALDPVNGVPLTWNPGRTRGRGVFDMVATPDGLWVGSDTDRIGSYEYHGRIAFFPLAGGTEVLQPVTPQLPVDVGLMSPPDAADQLVQRPGFDGTTAGAAEPRVEADIGWAGARGAFVVDDALYAAHDDGTFTKQTVASDGTFGPTVAIDLHGLTAFADDLARMTSLFYAEGVLYYTLEGTNAMFSRFFTVESDIVGGERFQVVGGRSGLGLKMVRGAFLVDGALFLAHRDSGVLFQVDWMDGLPLLDSRRRVSGPRVDGIDWRSNGLFSTSPS